MRQVRYHKHGGPEVLRIDEVAEPEPGPGQVLIEVEAVGANMIDTVFRAGTGLWQRPLPADLTGDVVGRVTGVGSGVTTAAAGDRVATLSEHAAADYVTADATWLARVPEKADAAEATMLSALAPLARGLLRAAGLDPSHHKTVLVQSAAGGVGHLLVQLAQILGAGRVIGTASTEEKRDFVRSFGALAVDSADPGWADGVRELAPDGVDIVLDSVGGTVFDAGVELLAPLGRMVTYGAIGGVMPTVSALNLFALKQVSGFSMLAWRAARPELALADMAEVADLFAAGRLRSAVHARVPLAQASTAHQILDARANSGRVVLIP
jgi:NADPH:quinone reductase-like Zn-dependent oxidoreductase